MIIPPGPAKRNSLTSTVTRYMGTPCAARESFTTRQYASEAAGSTVLPRPARRSAAAAAADAASGALRKAHSSPAHAHARCRQLDGELSANSDDSATQMQAAGEMQLTSGCQTSRRACVPQHTCRVRAQRGQLDERRVCLAQGGPQLASRLHVGPLGSACTHDTL